MSVNVVEQESLSRIFLFQAGAKQMRVEAANIVVDAGAGYLRVRGKKKRLSPTALVILQYLMENRGKYRTKSEIATHTWGEDGGNRQEEVEVYAAIIRSKIELKRGLKLLVAKDRFGYLFDPAYPENPASQPDAICASGVVFLPDARRAFARGAEPKMPRNAFRLLEHLMKNAGDVCSPDNMIRAIWPDRKMGMNNLHEEIRNLRMKIEEDYHNPRILLCVDKQGCYGCRGYMIVR